MAEASSIAEDARVQNAAATVMVEKLLHENAELADQVGMPSPFPPILPASIQSLAPHRNDREFSICFGFCFCDIRH